MDRLVSIVRSVRNIRAEVDTPLSQKVRLLIQADTEDIVQELQNSEAYIDYFCNPSELKIDTNIEVDEEAMTAVVSGAQVYLPLEGLIDFEEEIKRLEKELEKWQSEIDFVQNKLSNENFVNRAPEHIDRKSTRLNSSHVAI